MCRKLLANEIECRVGTCNEKGCSLLLYKTARVDRAILTEMYGNRWQNDFKVIDGKMYGGIAIYDSELKEWLWRWDCGTESNTEKEKGEASDCFKRAGFKWGIGIELYTAPFIWLNVKTMKNTNGKYQPISRFFELKEISYADNGNINHLKIVDDKGTVVYNDRTINDKNLIVNSDTDIIAGLACVSDLKNLEKYYKANKDKVSDINAFNAATNRRKTAIQEEHANGNI